LLLSDLPRLKGESHGLALCVVCQAGSGRAMKRWEYLRAIVSPDTTVIELDALGAEGWQLAGIVGGNVGWFVRDLHARQLRDQGERLAAERGGT
jgi:hypothetical protein